MAEVVPDSQLIAKPAGQVGPRDRQTHRDMVAAMKRRFEEQPRETVLIREEDGRQFVQINGYSFDIKAGEPVKVPRDVADLLRAKGVI